MADFPLLTRYIFLGHEPRYVLRRFPWPKARYTQQELDGFSKLVMLQERREELGRKATGYSGTKVPEKAW